jgi:hypothetical protein
MWAIVRTPGDQLYTVGYYNPRGEFVAHRDFETSDDAARFIHWLNGGDSREGFFDGDADLRRMVKRRGQQ